MPKRMWRESSIVSITAAGYLLSCCIACAPIPRATEEFRQMKAISDAETLALYRDRAALCSRRTADNLKATEMALSEIRDTTDNAATISRECERKARAAGARR